jgi:hypothetical protein
VASKKNPASKQIVHSVTTASSGLTKQQMDRSRKYMWSMSIRMVCFGLALLTDGILRWVFLAGSLVLPWVAVVIANAGLENRLQKADTSEIAHPRAIE